MFLLNTFRLQQTTSHSLQPQRGQVQQQQQQNLVTMQSGSTSRDQRRREKRPLTVDSTPTQYRYQQRTRPTAAVASASGGDDFSLPPLPQQLYEIDNQTAGTFRLMLFCCC